MLDKVEKYQNPGTNIPIDECVTRFYGQANDSLNILSESILTSFKVWTFGQQSYFLH